MTTRWNAILLFLFGLGANLYYQIIGYLAFSEMALVVAAPVAFLADGFGSRDRRIRPILVLGGLWLLAAALTDFWHGSNWSLALRGASRPVFLVASILVSYRLLKPDPKLVVWFYMGLIISNTISMYAFKTGSIATDEVMYDITIEGSFEKQIITIVMAAVPWLLFWQGGRFPNIAGVSTAALGLVSVFLGSRSAGAVMFVSGLVILAVRWFLRIDTGRFRLSLRAFSVVLIVGALGGWGVVKVYEIAASRGILGEAANKKYLEQTQNRFGLLVGGRLEFLGGAIAVADSPIIGHGSWPLDTKGFMLRAAEIANAELDPTYYRRLESGYVRIPTHSQLLETWVEHGIFAAFFWWYILGLLVRCTLRGVFVRPDLMPAVVVVLLGRWWDFFFSPLGGRMAVGASFALFLVLVSEAEERIASRSPGRSGRIPSMRRRQGSLMG